MKKRSGMIVRLIDVVLNLLFGFMAISNVQQKVQVTLPVSSQTKLGKPDTENLIPVIVHPNGRGGWVFLVENETLALADIKRLGRYFETKKDFYKREIRVKIYSEAKAPIRYLMQISDLCEKMNLKKSIVVKLSNRQSGLKKGIQP